MDSLMQQTYPHFHIFLADNGSEMGDVEALEANFGTHPKITLRLNKENLGFTKAHNLIFEELLEQDYEYIVTLNNDTVQEPNWLQELVNFAEEKGADMVSSKMINFFDRNIMDNAGHQMLNTAEIIPYASGEPIGQWNAPFQNVGPCAGAALYRADMLRQIGTFDERFTTGYEDAELGVRACILGYSAWYAPQAIVYHKVSASINKVINYDYKRTIQEHILYTYYKLMPKTVQWINFPSFVFKYGAVFMIDIVLRRKVFYKVMKEAWQNTLGPNQEAIQAARASYYKSGKPVSTYRILRMQRFFLWFDMVRFWKFVVLKERGFFEK